MANRVYIPNNGELNETFAEMSRDVFNSGVQNVDFAKNVEAAATINAWVIKIQFLCYDVEVKILFPFRQLPLNCSLCFFHNSKIKIY